MGNENEEIQDPAEPYQVDVNVDTTPNEAADEPAETQEREAAPSGEQAEGLNVDVNVSQPDNASDS